MAMSIDPLKVVANPTFDGEQQTTEMHSPRFLTRPKVDDENNVALVIDGGTFHTPRVSHPGLIQVPSVSGIPLSPDGQGESMRRYVGTSSGRMYVPMVKVVSRRGEAQRLHQQTVGKPISIWKQPGSRKFLLMMGLTGSFFFVELVTGVVIGSLALVTDAYHMLSDLVALGVGLYAQYTSQQKADRHSYTYGKQRAEVVGALINSASLMALCVQMIIEAVNRFVEISPPDDESCPDLKDHARTYIIVAVVGLLVNILGLVIFTSGNCLGSQSTEASDDSHSHAENHDHGHSHHGSSIQPPNSHGHSHGSAPQPLDSHGHSHGSSHGHNNDHSQRHGHGPPPHHSPSSSLLPPLTPSPPPAPSHDHDAGRCSSHGHNHDHVSGPAKVPDAHRNHSSVAVCESSVDKSEGMALKQKVKKKGHGHSHSHGGGHSHGDMNLHAVLLHVAGDALGSIGALTAGLIIQNVDSNWACYADPLMSVLITVIILYGSIPLLFQSSRNLMDKVPEVVTVKDCEEDILNVQGVHGIHDFHVWAVSSQAVVGSIHIMVADGTQMGPLIDEVKHVLHQHGVHSSTVQVELVSLEAIRDAPSVRLSCLDPICDDDITLKRLCCDH